ncbi:MAG: PIN domain-containing protein [Lentisphaerae bacterium]|nr:PIN domain-containing protein [Lentisphaerota bacterium]
MLSIDTNIFLYALNADCPECENAGRFLLSCSDRCDVVLCELVLVELYILLRNPAVVSRPLTAKAAAAACQIYRQQPCWRLVENAPVMEQVWKNAASENFARRRIIDARLARTLMHHGVKEFTTVNTRDFTGLGFRRVWNPLLPVR